MTSVADSSSLSSPSSIATRKKTSKELVQDALDANKRLQQILTHRAEQLEADLKEANSLLVSVLSFFSISFSLRSIHKIGCCECRWYSSRSRFRDCNTWSKESHGFILANRVIKSGMHYLTAREEYIAWSYSRSLPSMKKLLKGRIICPTLMCIPVCLWTIVDLRSLLWPFLIQWRKKILKY